MTTTAQVYKHAVEFAHANLGVTSEKELLTKALADFNSAGFEDKWWEFWNAHANTHRKLMADWDAKEKAASGEAVKQQPSGLKSSHVS